MSTTNMTIKVSLCVGSYVHKIFISKNYDFIEDILMPNREHLAAGPGNIFI
jgi:hypothetical protein